MSGSKALLLLAFSFILNGCSQGFKLSEEPKKIFNTKSCEFEFAEGEQALNEKLSEVKIKTTAFERQFNFALLEGILEASAESTVRFIEAAGVQIFKASPIASAGCSRTLFASLPEMPSDVSNYFLPQIEKANAEEGVLLGVYISNKTNLSLTSVKDKPAIVIRENANRWTLAHEFMHHLLKSKSSEQGVDEQEVSAKIDKSWEQISGILEDAQTTQKQKLEALVPLYTQYAQNMDHLVSLFPLEEIAIEVTLKELMAAGNFKYAPESSNAYILDNANKASLMIENVSELGSSLLHIAAVENDALAMKSLAAVKNKLSRRDQEIIEIAEKYQMPSTSVASEHVVELSSRSHRHSANHQDCAHSQITNHYLEKSRALKNIKF